MQFTTRCYSNKTVCKATGLSRLVLNEWIHRGLISVGEPEPGQGRPRYYSTLAAFRSLLEAGAAKFNLETASYEAILL